MAKLPSLSQAARFFSIARDEQYDIKTRTGGYVRAERIVKAHAATGKDEAVVWRVVTRLSDMDMERRTS